MATPTHPYYLSAWDYEQNIIQGIIHPTPVIPVPTKFNDGLGDIITNVPCHQYSINTSHKHFERAMDILQRYPIPFSMEEYCQRFRFREWDMVCETMLLAVQVKRLEPNEWQRFILGIFIHEHHPICCCECGLTPGFWCGECISFMILLCLMIFKEGDEGSEQSWDSEDPATFLLDYDTTSYVPPVSDEMPNVLD